MQQIETDIQGAFILEPEVYGDERGYFVESFSEKWFREHIGDVHFVQDNESFSTYGVLRGLHFQKPPHAQAKLVRVVRGKVLDVVVDIRPDSPTFGTYVAVELSGENKRQFFLPRGMAHGFVVLSEEALFQYKCDNHYAPESEGGIAWNDPALHIDWKIPPEDIILSEKDQKNRTLATLMQQDKHG